MYHCSVLLCTFTSYSNIYSAMVKFLSLIFVCIVITDGVFCHQEGKRQVSESEPTASEFAIHVHLS